MREPRVWLKSILRGEQLLEASADLLSPAAFVAVAKSQRHQSSHGEETAAVNRLREVFGLPRMAGGGSWHHGASARYRVD